MSMDGSWLPLSENINTYTLLSQRLVQEITLKVKTEYCDNCKPQLELMAVTYCSKRQFHQPETSLKAHQMHPTTHLLFTSYKLHQKV